MGRQAGSFIELAQEKDLVWLARFAALVAYAEPEACAKIADENAAYWAGYKIANAIRAREQA